MRPHLWSPIVATRVDLPAAHKPLTGSPASTWTDTQRVIFANDLAAPELRAVAGAVNFSKDHAGAEAWQPPVAGQCDFARSYVEVKRKYDLSVTARERDALGAMLATCPA